MLQYLTCVAKNWRQAAGKISSSRDFFHFPDNLLWQGLVHLQQELLNFPENILCQDFVHLQQGFHLFPENLLCQVLVYLQKDRIVIQNVCCNLTKTCDKSRVANL